MYRKCIRCNLKIADDTIKCPLCHGVVELMPDEGEDEFSPELEISMESESKSITYPGVNVSIRVMTLIIRLVIFLAIISQAVVMVINYFTFNGIYWSLIVGLGLLYGCFTLIYSVRTRRSIQRIIMVQMIVGIAAVIALDIVLGYRGWSVEYAIPFGLSGVDIGVVVLMIIGISDWQNLIMTEIVVFIFNIALVILGFCDVVSLSIWAILSLGVTGAILLGTVMLGQRMISNEIKRRFQV